MTTAKTSAACVAWTEVQKDELPLTDRVRQMEQETRALLTQLGAEFQAQLCCIDRELSQTQALLEDAIASLTESFTAIHHALNVFYTPSYQGEHATPAGKCLRVGLTEKLDEAVRSLQFQDMVHQLLKHISERLTEMLAVLADIEAAGAKPMNFLDYLDESREAVRRHEAIAEVRGVGPVSQGHIAAGAIDLF